KVKKKGSTKAEIKTSLFDNIPKNTAIQMSSDEMRPLELTHIFQEIKCLFDMYPELINLVTSEIISFMVHYLLTDGSSLDLFNESISNSIQDGINQILSTILNLYKTEVNSRDELMTENIKHKKRIKRLESKPSLFKVFSG